MHTCALPQNFADQTEAFASAKNPIEDEVGGRAASQSARPATRVCATVLARVERLARKYARRSGANSRLADNCVCGRRRGRSVDSSYGR